jgi:hypothetical protein
MTPLDEETGRLAAEMLSRVRRGEEESARLLLAAQKAHMDFARNPSDAAKARRAMLAAHAYQTRINTELGRVMAAYALLAKSEGDKAAKARAAQATAKTAQRREALEETAKAATARRSLMLQAMAAAEKAFDAAPGLPESVVGEMPGPAQVTVGVTEMFRPPSYIKRAGAFFPLDIRRAAGTLQGLEDETWLEKFYWRTQRDLANVVQRAYEYANEVASQDPAAAGLAQRAPAVVEALKTSPQGQAKKEEKKGSSPWPYVLVGGAVLYTLWKVLR